MRGEVKGRRAKGEGLREPSPANLKVEGEDRNRVGGKRSSFLPTFVFRPLTPPYVPFGIRRFLFWIPFEIRIRKTQVARLL